MKQPFFVIYRSLFLVRDGGECNFVIVMYIFTGEELKTLRQQLNFKDKVIRQLVSENQRLKKELPLAKSGQTPPIRQSTAMTYDSHALKIVNSSFGCVYSYSQKLQML